MKNKVLKNYVELFWIFILGSFAGFIYENMLTFLRGNWSLRQGLIYEPLIPIYGVGLVAFYLIANKLNITKNTNKKYLFKIFLVASFCGGFIEYICSYLQELIWGTISWDYSKLFLNINGRTSIPIAILWGSVFVIFSIYILPRLKKHQEIITKKTMLVLTTLLSILLLCDCTISLAATMRQKERQDGINPSNSVEVFLDEHYPDSLLDYIYNNAITVDK